LFWLAASVLAASFLLEFGDDGRLRLPLVGVELPEVCWWRRCTGVDCPGCGLTRSFVSLAHGDLSAAMHYHPLGVVLFVLVAAQLPYRLMQLARLARGHPPWTHPLLAAVLWLVTAGLLAEWLVKMLGLL
jgi:hypothetical protein